MGRMSQEANPKNNFLQQVRQSPSKRGGNIAYTQLALFGYYERDNKCPENRRGREEAEEEKWVVNHTSIFSASLNIVNWKRFPKWK